MSNVGKGSLEISLGGDKEWGYHISQLFSKAYGIRGSVYWHQEWVFEVESMRVVNDLAQFYAYSWNRYSWRVHKSIFDGDDTIKRGVLRGYFDADGYLKKIQDALKLFQ